MPTSSNSNTLTNIHILFKILMETGYENGDVTGYQIPRKNHESLRRALTAEKFRDSIK